MDIDSLLNPLQRFGVHLGLERIQRLLADLGNPHQRVPILHVTGTNGKGSVCAYLSAVLTEAGYRVGRYTSPHLIDWNERICLNEQPISIPALAELLLQVKAAIPQDIQDSPTQFEVITAAAWLYFAQQRVDIAVIEVGLGGRLDATNVCDSPLVSIITSLSREHWQNLGPTLADIAREKAGILKSGCPAVIGQLPPEAKAVVEARVKELDCPTVWVKPAVMLLANSENLTPQPPHQGSGSRSGKGEREGEFPKNWAEYEGIKYPLPLLGDIQLSNSAIAIATVQILRSQGWKITDAAIQNGMAKTQWLGRLQWTTWHHHRLLIDGAHNPAAAIALRQYVDTLNTPVTWVMGILSTKDHADIFEALLRGTDRLYLVPVPDHSSADPNALAVLARNICPELADCRTYPDLEKGLEAATSNPTETSKRLIVLCGSLYLVGHFLQNLRG
ncbi:bifunctional folylpolyglutamate synthase/dihydrofolate synthase [Allocoleopsis franciscana]|uniref:tetrahydrofolate synthase n=1 Tax=Allocoleopsis franciscana PCC 7113 TaxID=1173027 RepID=K9WJL6_9CYAN|nr:folylpolyglutamate synthase/dihydrofolate synthase family protein [Allocoleopsis franciscana]AFZ20388.1 folylpolyglutamate synthase/dihydrofolate synthase [Allocoleopsis franciscana PCC 7113]